MQSRAAPHLAISELAGKKIHPFGAVWTRRDFFIAHEGDWFLVKLLSCRASVVIMRILSLLGDGQPFDGVNERSGLLALLKRT